MPKATTLFQRAREVVALAALEALFVMLTDAAPSTFDAKLLEGSVLEDAASHADPAMGFIYVVPANLAATVLSAV